MYVSLISNQQLWLLDYVYASHCRHCACYHVHVDTAHAHLSLITQERGRMVSGVVH